MTTRRWPMSMPLLNHHSTPFVIIFPTSNLLTCLVSLLFSSPVSSFHPLSSFISSSSFYSSSPSPPLISSSFSVSSDIIPIIFILLLFIFPSSSYSSSSFFPLPPLLPPHIHLSFSPPHLPLLNFICTPPFNLPLLISIFLPPLIFLIFIFPPLLHLPRFIFSHSTLLPSSYPLILPHSSAFHPPLPMKRTHQHNINSRDI